MKKICYILPIIYMFVMIITSCTTNKSEDAISYKIESDLLQGNTVDEVELSFESTIELDENTTRAIYFDKGNLKKPIIDTKTIDVLTIVSSSGNNPTVVYRVIPWDVDPTVKNRIRLTKHRFKFPEGTTTAKGKKWYIMGIIGGTWDEKTKKLSMSSESISSLDKNGKIIMNMPVFSRWVEIPTETDGQFKFQKGNTNVVYSKMSFQSQGALIQHSFKGNTSAHNMTISSFTVVSTAFSFQGYFNLAKLPAFNSTGGNKNSTLFTWVPEAENTNKEYANTNASVKEYKKEFTLPTPITINAGSKGNANQVMTFWVMPTGVDLTKSRTNVFVKATAPNSPKMLRLPSYGKKHTALLKTGDVGELKSELHRPKLAIEYMADYNIKRKYNGANDWGAAGTRKPAGSTNQFANNHGRDAVSGLTFPEARAAAAAMTGYHLPTTEEWAGVLPLGGTQEGGTEGLYLKPSSQITSNITYSQKDVVVKVGSTTATYKYQLKQTPSSYNGGKNGLGTAYALHFVGANGNTMRVAYRYSMISNSAYQSEVGKTKRSTTVKILEQGYPIIKSDKVETDLLGKNYPFVVKDYHATLLKIDMIYLGSYFLGNIDDIAREDWWNENERKADIVTRYISTNTSELIAYRFFSGYDRRYRKRADIPQFIYPSNAMYWLAGNVPSGPRSDLGINYRNAFNFSMDSGKTDLRPIPNVTGLFVRLFSDI